MSTRALIGRYGSGGWTAAWHLFDSAPAVLGVRILRCIDGHPDALRRLGDSFLSRPCWREWPTEPETELEEFQGLATPETVQWAFDWAYLVSSRGIDLHSLATLRKGAPPLDSVEVLLGKPLATLSFRVPKAKDVHARVRRARSLEDLREALSGTGAEFESRMLAYAEIPAGLKLTFEERAALPRATRVTYLARKEGRCLREHVNADGTCGYVIEDFPSCP